MDLGPQPEGPGILRVALRRRTSRLSVASPALPMARRHSALSRDDFRVVGPPSRQGVQVGEAIGQCAPEVIRLGQGESDVDDPPVALARPVGRRPRPARSDRSPCTPGRWPWASRASRARVSPASCRGPGPPPGRRDDRSTRRTGRGRGRRRGARPRAPGRHPRPAGSVPGPVGLAEQGEPLRAEVFRRQGLEDARGGVVPALAEPQPGQHDPGPRVAGPDEGREPRLGLGQPPPLQVPPRQRRPDARASGTTRRSRPPRSPRPATPPPTGAGRGRCHSATRLGHDVLRTRRS